MTLEMLGVRTSGLLYCRAGTFPMVFLTMRTPMKAGERPTVPIMWTLSISRAHISFATGTRSSSVRVKQRLKLSRTCTIQGAGLRPHNPFDAAHLPHSGPDDAPSKMGSRVFGKL